MKPTYALFFLALLLLAHCAYALPTITAAVAVNSSSMTFRATGATNPPIYFKYGTVSNNYPWITYNTSNQSGGLVYWKETGVPLMSGTTFYYRCCDASGCSATELSSTLAAVTPAPTTTYGVVGQNISRSHFDLATLGGNIIEPTLWVVPRSEILFGIVLFFVFTGIWIRHRELIMPVIVGMIGAGLLFYSGTNSVGMPPEFMIVIIGIVAAGLTGVVLGLLKR
jgi:hypothetical protein